MVGSLQWHGSASLQRRARWAPTNLAGRIPRHMVSVCLAHVTCHAVEHQEFARGSVCRHDATLLHYKYCSPDAALLLFVLQ